MYFKYSSLSFSFALLLSTTKFCYASWDSLDDISFPRANSPLASQNSQYESDSDSFPYPSPLRLCSESEDEYSPIPELGFGQQSVSDGFGETFHFQEPDASIMSPVLSFPQAAIEIHEVRGPSLKKVRKEPLLGSKTMDRLCLFYTQIGGNSEFELSDYQNFVAGLPSHLRRFSVHRYDLCLGVQNGWLELGGMGRKQVYWFITDKYDTQSATFITTQPSSSFVPLEQENDEIVFQPTQHLRMEGRLKVFQTYCQGAIFTSRDYANRLGIVPPLAIQDINEFLRLSLIQTVSQKRIKGKKGRPPQSYQFIGAS